MPPLPPRSSPPPHTLLPYPPSFDGMNLLANGQWHQEQPADRIEFPYALLKVHTPAKGAEQGHVPSWMLPLVEQGLMIEVRTHAWLGYICGRRTTAITPAVPRHLSPLTLGKVYPCRMGTSVRFFSQEAASLALPHLLHLLPPSGGGIPRSPSPPAPPPLRCALQVYDFSKMSFGVCGLLPDMVRGGAGPVCVVTTSYSLGTLAHSTPCTPTLNTPHPPPS